MTACWTKGMFGTMGETNCSAVFLSLSRSAIAAKTRASSALDLMMRGILANCFEMMLGRTSVVCMMRSIIGEKDIFLA